MTDKKDNKGSGNNFNHLFPEGFPEQIAQFMKNITEVYTPVFKLNNIWMDEIKKTQGIMAKFMENIDVSGILETVKKIAASVDRVNVHFPENWPQDKKPETAKLCVNGVPVVFVPRAEIIDKLVGVKDMPTIKKILVGNDIDIIADCEKVLTESEWLTKDMRAHVKESIESYKRKSYRAAQSTASVAFDSLLNEVIDMRKWRKAKNNKSKLAHSMVKLLTEAERFKGDLMDLPLGRAPFYTLLMFPIVGQMLTPFEIGDKDSYGNNANRHMSAHTVSGKQYKRSNALLAIMTVVSICKVTQLPWKELDAGFGTRVWYNF